MSKQINRGKNILIGIDTLYVLIANEMSMSEEVGDYHHGRAVAYCDVAARGGATHDEMEWLNGPIVEKLGD